MLFTPVMGVPETDPRRGFGYRWSPRGDRKGGSATVSSRMGRGSFILSIVLSPWDIYAQQCVKC